MITTDAGTLVQLTLNPTVIDTVSAALVHELAASDEASGWSTMTRRLATDLAAGALETLSQERGERALAAMPDPCLRQLSSTRPAHRTALLSVTACASTWRVSPSTSPSIGRLPLRPEEPPWWNSNTCSDSETPCPLVRLAPLLQDQHLTVLSAAPYQALREALP